MSQQTSTESNNALPSAEPAPALMQSTLRNEPPPAYEITASSTPQASSAAESVPTVVEAPPPYCLVDPSKIQHTEHLPHYSHITPVEVIDLHTTTNPMGHEQSTHQPAIAAWLASGSSMDVGTDCTFLMAFIIAFFFNWLGFLAVVCLIPTIAARFGAMSGFGLSVVKWVTVMRYHEFNNTSSIGTHFLSSGHRSPAHDPAQNFVFALVLFAGFFLFIRGLISYVAVKNRVNQHGHSADVFTWY